jgi:co-chaperonin GroES (HSP10)
VQTQAQAFPDGDPGVKPVGSRLIVQIRNSALKTEAGIELVNNTTETEFDNTQTARVVAVGPLAFCNRETMAPWPEGAWCKVGDYVRVPKYGRECWRRPGPGGISITYSMIDDLQIVGVVTADPLDFQAFL